MVRVAATAAVVSALLVIPGAALAADGDDIPLEPTGPTPGKTPASQRQDARLKVTVDDHKLRLGQRTLVSAKLSPSLSGEPLRFTLKRGDRVISRRSMAADGDGKASWQLKPDQAGRFRVKVQHPRSTRIGPAVDVSKPFAVKIGSLAQGNHGVDVKLFKRGLRKLGYAIDGGSAFTAATGRAVLAYRKANGMPRTEFASSKIVRAVLAGKGGVKLRHPGAGRHVEADISRQILILADDGKPVEVYHTSSGTSATPTILGKYHFYMQTPGYNSKEMYYSSYFIRGYAIHGYDPVPTYPASHGCLRVPISDAIHIYKWVEIGMPIYTYR